MERFKEANELTDLGRTSMGPASLVWKAKNVKNDMYDLEQPRWISDIQFLESDSLYSFKVAVCTRFHQVRVYDTAKSRRPIINCDLSDMPLLCIQNINPSGNDVIVSDSKGNIFQVDVSIPKVKGKYSDERGTPKGSIISLDVNPAPIRQLTATGETSTEPLDSGDKILAAAGLDRYVRVYNAETRKLLARAFCKTSPTQVVILNVDLPEDENARGSKRSADDENNSNSNDSGSDDDLWDELDAAGARNRTKRRRVS